MSLYKHLKHPHLSLNANQVHKSEQTGLNTRVALVLTKSVGTMVCAYLFALLAILGFPLLPFGTTATQLVQWTSQTFIQLTMLSVIMVGQTVLGRKAEIQAEEAFKRTQNSYHDLEQIMAHLDAQDEKISEIFNSLKS